MSKIDILKAIQASGKSIFTVNDLQRLLDLKRSYLYVMLHRLEGKNIIERLFKGYYKLAAIQVSDFEIANFFYYPSYISLESALNYYGILIQSPYHITSVTSRPTKKIMAKDKEYIYSHLDSKYFSNYQKIDNFLIATPEKALVDMIFFTAIGQANIDVEELLLDQINIREVKKLAAKIKNRAFQKHFNLLKL